MKNRRVFLYVGLSKPETHLLQEIFARYGHLIKEEGINHLQEFDNLSEKLLSNKPQETLFESIPELLHEKIQLSQNSDDQSYLIIDSVSTDLQDHNQLAKLYNKISKQISLSPTIIFFLKRQDLFVESSFQHEIQEKSSVSFSEYLNQLDERDLDWHRMVTPYSDIFGKENIILHDFHSNREFLQNLGSIIGSDRIKYYSVSLDRKSYPNATNTLSNLTNSYLTEEEIKQFDKLFGHKIDRLKERSYFDEKQRMDFLKNFDESNGKLSNKFHENLTEQLFSDSNSLHVNHGSQDDVLSLETVSFLFTKAILEFKNHPEKKIKQQRQKHPFEKGVLKIWRFVRLTFQKLNLNFLNR